MFLPLCKIVTVYDEPILIGDIWDKQTIVFKVRNHGHMITIMRKLRQNLKPQSVHDIVPGIISESYVNLNYEPWDKDPSNRNVRLVYVMMDICTNEMIVDRFDNAYVFDLTNSRR